MSWRSWSVVRFFTLFTMMSLFSSNMLFEIVINRNSNNFSKRSDHLWTRCKWQKYTLKWTSLMNVIWIYSNFLKLKKMDVYFYLGPLKLTRIGGRKGLEYSKLTRRKKTRVEVSYAIEGGVRWTFQGILSEIHWTVCQHRSPKLTLRGVHIITC